MLCQRLVDRMGPRSPRYFAFTTSCTLMDRRYSANGPDRSPRRSAKYTTAFRNPSLLPVSCRTPFISQA